jgi:hypothetical protein
VQKQQLPARKELVVGFRTLAARLGRAHKDVRPKNERAAYAMALLAVGDFLKVNGANGIIEVWLWELGSALTDLDMASWDRSFRPKGTSHSRRIHGAVSLWSLLG